MRCHCLCSGGLDADRREAIIQTYNVMRSSEEPRPGTDTSDDVVYKNASLQVAGVHHRLTGMNVLRNNYFPKAYFATARH